MSNHLNLVRDIPQAVSTQNAEAITAAIVMPMLQLAQLDFTVLKDGEFVAPKEGEAMAAIKFDNTIMCLHLWQAAVAAMSMKIQSQNVLAYLLSIHSLDFDLRNRLAHDIQVADDNIKFVSEQLLQYGIKLI